ncbi:MAG: ATP-binding protein [Spirochaetaceae bacterium]|nr:ATP-binding protein [Spirochaetaceae bacterium]
MSERQQKFDFIDSYKEELIINNFLNLKTKISFGSFNCLTGSNAVGKTVIFKLLSFFHILPRVFEPAIEGATADYIHFGKKDLNKKLQERIDNLLHQEFIKFFPASKEASDVYKKNFDITYSCLKNGTEEIRWELKCQEEKITTTSLFKEADLKSIINGIEAKIKSSKISAAEEKSINFESYQYLLDVSSCKSVWKFINLKNDIREKGVFLESEHESYYDNLNARGKNSNSFISIDSNNRSEVKISSLLEKLATELKVKSYRVNENNKVIIKTFKDKEMLITQASSGQRDNLSIIVLLNNLIRNLENEQRDYNFFISLIEELGNYLYPSGSVELLKAFVTVFLEYQTKKTPLRIYISTHSSYILNLFNLFLKYAKVRNVLGSKYEKYKEELSLYLNEEDLYIYSLEEEAGFIKAVDIKKDIGIYAEKFVDVSNQLIEQMNRADEIEYLCRKKGE